MIHSVRSGSQLRKFLNLILTGKVLYEPMSSLNQKRKVTVQPYKNVIVKLNSPQIDNCTQVSKTFEIDGL